MSDLTQMFEQMRRSEESALERMPQWQKELDAGGWFVSPRPEYGLVIWVDGWSIDERVRVEMSYGADELGPSESEFRSRCEETDRRGYVFGRCYSVIEPTGELGSTHRSHLLPITEAEFEDAKAAGWNEFVLTDELEQMAKEAWMPKEAWGGTDEH